MRAAPLPASIQQLGNRESMAELARQARELAVVVQRVIERLRPADQVSDDFVTIHVTSP